MNGSRLAARVNKLEEKAKKADEVLSREFDELVQLLTATGRDVERILADIEKDMKRLECRC